ncbi:putative Macrophage mannose receptor 1 [Hypsibius exemplaris]|uniref:Macrophage mannose receptor 1 n=1 Tax=Hypsibius exemplaris TaxID=2072580 RepID=A0A1W0X735_HYPEX|nr:putative Macrophage mannose receptor 1 [Hypsibius exemplaris]
MLRIYFTRNLLLLTSLALVSRGEEDHILPDGIFANDLKAVPAVSEACGSGNSNGDWYYDDVTQNCFFYSSIIATWPEAERQCVLMDSHLATIEQRNHEFVRLVVQGGKPGWTPAWIGLRLSHLPTMTHTWVDGNLTNLYRPWGDNEPSPQGLEGCVVINSDTGKFSDYRCLANPGMRFVCRKTKAGEIPPITTSAPLEVQDHWGCPIDDRPGLLRFGSFCYWFSGLGEVKNWNDALKTCQDLYHHPNDPSKSSSLVSIHSDLENDFLVSHMGDRVPRWTGMREESDGTTAYWADGSFVNYLNWHFGEPRPSGAQCVSMYAEPARTGMWDDTDCGSSFGFICKMQKDPSKPAPESPGNPCPENFRQYKNGVCFGIVPVSAFATCAHVGPNIRPASILSRSENAFIRVLAHESNKFAPTNATAWLGGKELRGSVKWDSGCYATFNNIAHFYDAPYPVDNCIIMHYNGVWRTVNCELEQLNVPYVVCERREGEGECDKTEPSDVQGVCPMGFPKDCGDFCYRLGGHVTSSQSQIDAQATWEEAKTACANMGSSLVTIRNEKDQRCVEKLLTESDWHLWIGLYYQDNLVTPPTPPSGRWKWLDPLYEFQQTFVNWQAGEPNYMDPNSQYRELCAEMLHGLEKPEDDGKWNNRHCSNGRKQGYICEKVKSPLNNATCGFSDTGDWFYDSKTDNCFFVSRTLASWPNAERTCNSMDSHLATIEQDNHEFVKQILALDYPAGTNFWIGLRLQHIQTMTHTWVDGNVANVFRAWDNNEPNSEGAEACVVMNNLNGKWHDYRCQWANGYRFVCRKPKTPVVPVIPPVIQDHWGCPTACTNCIRYGEAAQKDLTENVKNTKSQNSEEGAFD